jgi:hypothetical protein
VRRHGPHDRYGQRGPDRERGSKGMAHYARTTTIPLRSGLGKGRAIWGARPRAPERIQSRAVKRSYLSLVVVCGLLLGCSPSSRAGARKSVIPTSPVFSEDSDTSAIGVRAIYVAYKGAEGAPSDLTRSKEQAQERAVMVANVAQMAGRSFPELVRKYSDRPPLKDGGGPGARLERGKGLLPSAAEQSAFRLSIGEVSAPVQTEQGYMILMRTETPRQAPERPRAPSPSARQPPAPAPQPPAASRAAPSQPAPAAPQPASAAPQPAPAASQPAPAASQPAAAP